MSIRRLHLVAAALGSTLLTGAVALASVPADAATPMCGNAQIKVSHTASDGAMGHSGLTLVFKNVSAHSCGLYGYPGLDALTSTGRVLAHAQRTMLGAMGGAHTKKTVLLTPGSYASARVEWMNFDPVTSSACTYSAKIATTPANTTRTVVFRTSVSICALQVHPTVAGTSGMN
jgi:hypothetical protein